MTEAQELEILKDALYHFGYNHQATKCIEEMSKLTKELCKEKDGQGNLEHIAEEIVDVYITLDQMVIYHDIYQKVKDYRESEIRRLQYLIFMEQYG